MMPCVANGARSASSRSETMKLEGNMYREEEFVVM